MTKKLEEFWESNEGKLIKGYGKWLIAYGIIVILVSAFFLFYAISKLSVESLEYSDQAMVVVLYYLGSIAVSIYYINRGNAIKKMALSPSQIQSASTAVIVLQIFFAIWTVILSGGAVKILFGLLDVITLLDAIRYKRNGHKAYLAAYEGKNLASFTKSNPRQIEPQTKDESKAETKSKAKPIEEYEDDLL